VDQGEVRGLLLQHVRSSGVEDHEWEAPVHSCENGGGAAESSYVQAYTNDILYLLLAE
jgi:hypothetical protein